MPMLISTGKCPSPSGRKTSALSLAPSRIGMSTSFSSFILYVGSDGLVCLRVATCSCTVPPQQLLFFQDRPIAAGRLIGTDGPSTTLAEAATRGYACPHTSRAVSTTRRSLAISPVTSMVLPPMPLEKPHCGLSASCSSGACLDASSTRRLSSSLDSSLPLLVVTKPSTAILPLGRKRSGSKPPARVLSYSRK